MRICPDFFQEAVIQIHHYITHIVDVLGDAHALRMSHPGSGGTEIITIAKNICDELITFLGYSFIEVARARLNMGYWDLVLDSGNSPGRPRIGIAENDQQPASLFQNTSSTQHHHFRDLFQRLSEPIFRS